MNPAQSSFYASLIRYRDDFWQEARIYTRTLDVDKWYQSFSSMLVDVHARSAFHGAWLSTDKRPQRLDEEFLRVGRMVAQNQAQWVLKFRAKLEDNPELTTEQIARQMSMYLGRAQGTANEAFLHYSPPLDIFAWQTTSGESCPSCEYFGSLEPMPAQEWPTSPRANDTECLFNCKCVWIREPGSQSETSGFMPAVFWAEDEE
jgi:hypothetical protein